MLRTRRLAIVTGISTALLAGATPAFADTSDDALSALLQYSPGASFELIEQSLRDYAAAHGLPFDQVVQEALAQGKQSAEWAARERATTDRPAWSGGGLGHRALIFAPTSSGGVTANITLGTADAKGDIFISAAATWFVEHGHTGIYADRDTIVEAPGAGQNSRTNPATETKVAKGAVKQHVDASQDQRDSAANYARDNLVGKGYNINFAFNKDANGSTMNCSQLVWAAYIKADNIDLDGNGGPGVYPYDIKDSNNVSTYATL